MRIALNAECLADIQTDLGRYMHQLIESIGTIDGVNEYLALTYHPLALRPATPSSFTWEELPVNAPNEQMRRVAWEQRIFPDIARRRNAKVLFIPYFAPPAITPLPYIVTVHDLLPFALPDYRPSTGSWMYQQVLAKVIKRATVIITVSEFMKSEIIRLLNVPAENITIIQGAPGLQFRPITDTTRLRAIRSRYRLTEQFLVYNGGFDSRKNIPLLLGAFAASMHRLQDTSTQLLILGDTTSLGSDALHPDWQPLVRTFGLSQRVISAIPLDEDLPALYSQAAAFIYPSFYEGFGWHVLDAMSCGAPVIIADHPALQETIGSAGLSFMMTRQFDGSVNGTASIRAMTNQMTRLLADPALREEYHQRGLARAKQFSWSQTAAETSAIFAQVAGVSN